MKKNLNDIKTKNILGRADKIVNERAEDRERMYGDFTQSIVRASKIATLISGVAISPGMMFYALIGLKLSREQNGHKQDNLLDAVAYLGALDNYWQEVEDTFSTIKDEVKVWGEVFPGARDASILKEDGSRKQDIRI